MQLVRYIFLSFLHSMWFIFRAFLVFGGLLSLGIISCFGYFAIVQDIFTFSCHLFWIWKLLLIMGMSLVLVLILFLLFFLAILILPEGFDLSYKEIIEIARYKKEDLKKMDKK